MKNAIVVLFTFTGAMCVTAQQPTVPRQPVNPPANVPRGQDSGNLPPGRAFNPTNPPPGRRFAFTNRFENNPFATASNQFGATNPLSPTGAAMTNGFGATNSSNSGMNQNLNLSVTNALSSMSPVQAQAVVQFQGDLSGLQNVALNVGGVQNVRQVIQQNPQVQHQLQQVQVQISNLTRGRIQASDDIVQRFSEDLFRSLAPARLSPEGQLVLAIIINQACNSEHLSQAQLDQAVQTGLNTLQSAGVPLSVAHTVGCDMHSIAYQLQPTLAR